MSWKATAYVKQLRRAPNGEPITKTEKLLLFVLADSHNADYDLAWPSLLRMGADALLCERETRSTLRDVVRKGVIEIVPAPRRGRGYTQGYRFCELSDDGKKGARHAPFSVTEGGKKGARHAPFSVAEGGKKGAVDRQEGGTKGAGDAPEGGTKGAGEDGAIRNEPLAVEPSTLQDLENDVPEPPRSGDGVTRFGDAASPLIDRFGPRWGFKRGGKQ